MVAALPVRPAPVLDHIHALILPAFPPHRRSHQQSESSLFTAALITACFSLVLGPLAILDPSSRSREEKRPAVVGPMRIRICDQRIMSSPVPSETKEDKSVTSAKQGKVRQRAGDFKRRRG